MWIEAIEWVIVVMSRIVCLAIDSFAITPHQFFFPHGPHIPSSEVKFLFHRPFGYCYFAGKSVI